MAVLLIAKFSFIRRIILGVICPRGIGLTRRVFANGSGDWGSIPGSSHIKDSKMVLDSALLNTHHYKVRIKGKVEQAREWSSALSYTLV